MSQITVKAKMPAWVMNGSTPAAKKCTNPEYKSYFPRYGSTPDVTLTDMPCDYAPLQWWYGNAHLNFVGHPGSRFSFFASFFRQCQDVSPKENSSFLDACTWALVDLENEKYYCDSLLDPRSIEVIRNRVDPERTGIPVSDGEAVMLESVKKGLLPRPDRLMKARAVYQYRPFRISLDEESVFEAGNRNSYRYYRFTHTNPTRGISVDLVFETDAEPVLQGEDGVVNHMYYYYFPSMMVSGTVTINGVTREVEGLGWYDREYGGDSSLTGKDALDAWTWYSLHLSNGAQLTIFRVANAESGVTKQASAIYTKGKKRVLCPKVDFTYKSEWTSLVTFITYPDQAIIDIPELDATCHVNFAFKPQEFVTIVVPGCGFYEGRVDGTVRMGKQELSVFGFVECKGSSGFKDTESLMKAIGRFVRKTLAQLYPDEPTKEFIEQEVLGRHATGRGTPPDKVAATIFKPVRSIIDRGGKAWRSLIMVSCCNAISADYIDCTKYIALAELLHVGSLVIDDIEDNSSVRRGGPCVHLEYGTATAINAGSMCYFMAPLLGGVKDLPAEKAARVYDLYFDALRAGHAGQGLDIYGLDYLMPETVRTGNAQPAVDALEAIHVYKTGGAAGTVCLMACLLCEADERTTKAIENFGVKLGLAFQIVDDALNIKGFEGTLKETAEDIKDGKVTYPVVKAMGKLDLHDRQKLWGIVSSKPQDRATIEEAVALLNKVNSVEECLLDARRYVEESWKTVDGLLAESVPKNMMKTFCKYLTDRTY